MRQVTVQSYGGGVNSLALALGCYEREIPVDLRLFADTGGEKTATYEHIGMVDRWLFEHGLADIEVVREERWTLEEEMLREKTLPSIVLGRRSCSDKFKIRPQNRFLRQWQPAVDTWARDERVNKLVGFDAEEDHRLKDYSDTRYLVTFPLVEWGWTREDCVACIKRHGLPVPPKSSCFFCPEMQWEEIVALRADEPGLLDRALAMEENNVKMHSVAGLYRSMSWKQALVHIDAGEIDKLPKKARRLHCVCFDGDNR